MFNQCDFGKRLKTFRNKVNLTQKDVAKKIGISEQAISKWENGICLPDAYNLMLLGKVLNVSIDCLLDMENELRERVVETIEVGGAKFELIEKAETLFAGKMLYAKDYTDIDAFYQAIDATTDNIKEKVYSLLVSNVLPVCDIQLSVNFWREDKIRAYGFVREVACENQPSGVDIYKMPASLFVRAYTDKSTAQLMAKEQCEVWELFAYIRNYFMPNHGFKMAENGAQELEVFDAFDHKSGYAYVPIMKA